VIPKRPGLGGQKSGRKATAGVPSCVAAPSAVGPDGTAFGAKKKWNIGVCTNRKCRPSRCICSLRRLDFWKIFSSASAPELTFFCEIDAFYLAYLHKTELCLLCINTMKKMLTFLYIATTMKENHGKEIHQ